ncbi:MAG: hypothetical protein Q8P53_01725 [Candidatus Shapirobacteria bacterium]|nr:hypothetical protein [Candidatus Shapirobacteria bacterium]
MKLNKIILILVLGISLFFRIYGLEKAPASINFDEASLGYNAYSLANTGRDEYGNFLPFSLRSFNDFKPALYSYVSIPFVKILGLNQTSTRLASAVFGTISLFFLYLILKDFIAQKWLLPIFFILSFEPWSLHYSRTAFESNLSASFFLMGMYGWLNFGKNKLHKFLTVVGFLLSIYSYHSARLAVPLVLLLSIFDPIKLISEKKLTFKYFLNKNVISGLVVLLVIFVLSLPIFFEGKNLVLRRFEQTNVFKQMYPFAPNELLNNIKNPWLSLKSNPSYYLLGILSGHVFSYFSPKNLGGLIYDWVENSPQVISGMGMFEWIGAIVFIFGLINLLSNIKKYSKYRIILYWILASAAPAVITLNWYHPLRFLNGYMALEIILALGLVSVFDYIAKNIKNNYLKILSFFLISSVFVLNIIYIINNELVYSVWDNNGQYQPGGFKEGAMLLKSLEKDHNIIYIDSPHAQNYIFFWFYQQRDPREIQSYQNLRPIPGKDGKYNDGNLIFDYGKYVYKKYDWLKDRNKNNFIYWYTGDFKEDEILREKGTKIYKLPNAVYDNTVVIITKD